MEASTDLIRVDIRRTQEALATCEEGALRPLLERQLVELVALLARREEGPRAKMAYAVQYAVRDLKVPGLQRLEWVMGRSRSGAEVIVRFATKEAAENAASVQRAQKGVLRADVVAVLRAV